MKVFKQIFIAFCAFVVFPVMTFGQNLNNDKNGNSGKMRITQEVKPDGSVWLVVSGGSPPYMFNIEGTGYWFEQVDSNGLKMKTKKIVQHSDRIRMYGFR